MNVNVNRQMDQFDAITRRLGSAESTRRQMLRALGGALLGGMLGTMGLAEVSEAGRPKHRKHKGKEKQQKSCSGPGVPGDGPVVPRCTPTTCPSGSTFNTGVCKCQCADNSFVCPAGNQCCGPFMICTVDGCCDQSSVCLDRGVERCCR